VFCASVWSLCSWGESEVKDVLRRCHLWDVLEHPIHLQFPPCLPVAWTATEADRVVSPMSNQCLHCGVMLELLPPVYGQSIRWVQKQCLFQNFIVWDCTLIRECGSFLVKMLHPPEFYFKSSELIVDTFFQW